jgi:hypothetical protein
MTNEERKLIAEYIDVSVEAAVRKHLEAVAEAAIAMAIARMAGALAEVKPRG